MHRIERDSPCKVNLLLNILGKRADGFHELETVMQPVPLHDTLWLERRATGGIELTCNNPALPVDASNLVHRAAASFLATTGINEGVRIHLEKRLPLAAGLGAGSSNAAITLLALNELFDHAIAPESMQATAASLGSDVPFFLQSNPALGTNRGERITPLPPFATLRGKALFLFHPGFGVATAWAYQALAGYSAALHGERGRAERLISLLQAGPIEAAGREFYNSLEAPVLHKYPILGLYQEFLRGHGALGTLMSGSGSSTFGIFANVQAARETELRFREKFGPTGWLAIAEL